MLVRWWCFSASCHTEAVLGECAGPDKDPSWNWGRDTGVKGRRGRVSTPKK